MKIFAAFVILLQVSQQASAETFKVKEGDESVLLPCKVTAPLPEDTVVEWKRLNPEITVHRRSDNRDQPGEQNQLFRTRTSLRQDAVQSGDLSLTLKNITPLDQGTFTCSASQGQKTLFSKQVELQVYTIDEKYYFDLYVTFLVLFIITLFGGVLSAVLVYKKYIMKGRSAVDM
ncbi:myelin-oligodendrocyte glycoprotein-like isoform X1 [Scomber scombrus]|uniref:myelin-oligodendrocyte glycoprotein-like isoform X1 n=2 Tax=Scomber scombrus TaxID=13677 RepID=UPI002DD95869|nr:myelin-oligodendrocyte glycoprotein-like isoform X1 [Scomber scombrus]